MDKLTKIYQYNGILISNKNKWIGKQYKDINECMTVWVNIAKWKNPVWKAT